MALVWVRQRHFGFFRYVNPYGVTIFEGTRGVNVAPGWGQPRHTKTEKYWRVEDVEQGHRTVGVPGGYLRLRDAKAAAEAYLIRVGLGRERVSAGFSHSVACSEGRQRGERCSCEAPHD